MLHQPSSTYMNSTRLAGFAKYVQERYPQAGDFSDCSADTYRAIHDWSVENLADFHDAVWEFCGIIGDKGGVVLSDQINILAAAFFPDTKISFSENMLARAATHADDPAIISRTAGASADRILSWSGLYDEVSLWVQVLEKLGVGEGERVATYLPHGPEAYVLMIASAHVGAIFSSVGTEMGAQSTAERFKQIAPKILIAADGYTHMKALGEDGKPEARLPLVAHLQKEVESLEHTVIVPNLSEAPAIDELAEGTLLSSDLMLTVKPKKLEFLRRDFNQPLAILFSSGSTGQPKCFVHGVGGTLLKHAIEHQLQSDVRAGDRVFFHSTTSWMMFNWLASGLANGATIMIYDGNPAYPDADSQLQLAAEYGCTHLGTAAGVIQDVWARNGLSTESLDLSALKMIMYTGSVLSDQGFEYLYKNIKKDMAVNGICGGTDFVGCYAAGNPFTPTLAGYLKGPVLGMDVAVWDDEGNALPDGASGELVVKGPFASRPLYFWNDEGGARFRAEYFEYFDVSPPVWRHGDAVKRAKNGQIMIEGRSDTTLNQGGVRIGPQMLYDALNSPELQGKIEDSLAASFKDADGGDHTALFLEADQMDEAFLKQVKGIISDSVGRLSCPHEIICVPYVLKTPNGKKAEKPTAQLLAGKEIQAPATYGEEGGVLYADLYKKIGESLRAKPQYGFAGNAAE